MKDTQSKILKDMVETTLIYEKRAKSFFKAKDYTQFNMYNAMAQEVRTWHRRLTEVE